MKYKLDILAIAAHPDDVELACSGTILKEIKQGKKVGIVDLTQGELGSRGNAQTRAEEAEKASSILGISVRENLALADGFFNENYGNLIKVVEVIRKYRPEIVLTNALSDRHPDHGRGGDLVSRACFLSGLIKVETQVKNKWQEPWRPKQVYRFVQDRYIKPDFVVDISEFWEQRMQSILAYKTQFYQENEEGNEPKTPISSKSFLDFVEARCREFGRQINVDYAEGFNVERPIGVSSLFDLT